jgi:hypothetical protein
MVEPGQEASSKRTVPVAVDAALGAAAMATNATVWVDDHAPSRPG